MSSLQLRERVEAACGDQQVLGELFACETSLAFADGQGDYRIGLSTAPARVGQLLLLEGFERLDDERLCQRLQRPDGRAVVRTFIIDTLEPNWRAEPATPATAESQAWFAAEGETLSRYLQVLS